ncbi:receptor-like serine/threonine-protein kinase SD1-8 [Daucus carota subsp. sativus]|uniref:receptor-like serine/threonine-protein kinase SD1-8 n=1 Tax=Daucus carota subsp. sativus TaxID=79200 RepID=UPI0007EF407A|nr:PREDICTED: receptor-like serine/threonine-protein kinase SD1-8 [Daucus carota subsp. sativus]
MQVFMKMVSASKLAVFQLIILISIYIFSMSEVGLGLDTISSGHPLFGNQSLVSKGGKFEMGFFSPGKSTNFYVGIWYKNIPVKTVVWVANRETPLRRFSDDSRLELAEDGSLILFNESNVKVLTVISTSVGLSSVPVKGVLRDDGNFVLSDGVSIVWDSFNYPTDTWLPHGKVGVDESLINRNQLLTSWKNPNDPGEGEFSFGIDEGASPELFMWRNRSKVLWRSGSWNDHKFASLESTFTNFSYNLVEQARYFSYVSENITSRFVLTHEGQINQMLWSESTQSWAIYLSYPRDSCSIFALCGSFGVCDLNSAPSCSCFEGFVPRLPVEWSRADWSSGCVRAKALKCSNDGFIRVKGISMPADSQSLSLDSAQVCEYACLRNCSCIAYSYSRSRCSLWTGDLLNTQISVDFHNKQKIGNVNGYIDIYLRSSEAPASRSGVLKKKKHSYVSLALYITIPIVITAILLLYLLWYIWRKKNKKRDAEEANENLLSFSLDISGQQNTYSNSNRLEGEKKDFNLPQFSFSSICAATDNFSSANKLGEGGFGPVYKGNLSNGQSVAVKRLSKRSGQGLDELKNETILIAKLQHRNLVRLLGCCLEQDEKILIYEHLPNKSLDFFIFDPSKQHLLDWRRRVQIIEGITQGLLYLHQHSRLRIIHRDLKASNILLDDQMNPKISDFGMAKIFGEDELQANTKRIVGTYGYMSPEYAMEGLFSVKSDVFAFGVLLLEILSGKKNTGFRQSDCISLLGYAWELWKTERVLELIDSTLELPASFLPLRFIHVGLLCVQENPA